MTLGDKDPLADSAQPLVAVFTPVYNGAEFLRECVESVLAQTYQNWRYLILDNASTDGTGEIADEYARRDSRIRVVHSKTLLPIIQNHNRAIELAVGDAKYVKPLWGDDWLYPECIERLVVAAEADPSIGLVCSLAFDGRFVCWDGFPYPATCVPGAAAAQVVLRDGAYVFGTPTSTLVRADLVRKRAKFYNEDHWHADFEACLDVLLESNFAFVHQVLSLNRVHDGRNSKTAEEIDSMVAGNVYMLLRYGQKYLTPTEYERIRVAAFEDYYDILARGVMKGKGKAYRDYHRRYMRMGGYTISNARLGWAMTRVVLSMLGQPISSAKKIFARSS